MQKKVYLEIVDRIRDIIEQDGLTVGDKIPSERELAARLGVGRSSVREALRSLELLGLIETRVGGGTFIKNFGEHRLVQLVGTFILLDQQTKQELIETKTLLEREGVMKAIQTSQLDELEKVVQALPENVNLSQNDEFFRCLIKEHTNHLVYRIWSVCNDYFQTMFSKEQSLEKKYFQVLLDEMKTGNQEKTIATFQVIQEQIIQKLD